MTRPEIEGFIIDKLNEIKNKYLEYNPYGDFLSLCIQYSVDGNGNDNGDWDCWRFSVNNSWYDDKSPDAEKPVEAWGHEDVKNEKYYRCNPEEDDED